MFLWGELADMLTYLERCYRELQAKSDEEAAKKSLRELFDGKKDILAAYDRAPPPPGGGGGGGV